MSKPTNMMCDAAVRLLQGKALGLDPCGETLSRLFSEGYVDLGCHGEILTWEGEELARAHVAKTEAARKARNAGARARNGIMRDLGMTRARNGMWE